MSALKWQGWKREHTLCPGRQLLPSSVICMVLEKEKDWDRKSNGVCPRQEHFVICDSGVMQCTYVERAWHSKSALKGSQILRWTDQTYSSYTALDFTEQCTLVVSVWRNKTRKNILMCIVIARTTVLMFSVRRLQFWNIWCEADVHKLMCSPAHLVSAVCIRCIEKRCWLYKY